MCIWSSAICGNRAGYGNTSGNTSGYGGNSSGYGDNRSGYTGSGSNNPTAGMTTGNSPHDSSLAHDEP